MRDKERGEKFSQFLRSFEFGLLMGKLQFVIYEVNELGGIKSKCFGI